MFILLVISNVDLQSLCAAVMQHAIKCEFCINITSLTSLSTFRSWPYGLCHHLVSYAVRQQCHNQEEGHSLNAHIM
jgi:hypothetical protein